MGGIQIKSSKEYYFDNPESVLADKQKAVAGLREGVNIVAQNVTEHLKRE